MTDRQTCSAFYDGRPEVQLTPDALLLGYYHRGGLVAYAYRLDDGQQIYQFANGREADSGIANIAGASLARVLNAHRLRVRASTRVAGTIDEDFDITGIEQVMALFATKGCGPVAQPPSSNAVSGAPIAYSGYAYGPNPDWSRFRELAESAALAQLTDPHKWSISWPHGYIAGGWAERHTKAKVPGYLACGMLNERAVPDRAPTYFAIVIDHDQVKLVGIEKDGRRGFDSVVCSALIQHNAFPPAPAIG